MILKKAGITEIGNNKSPSWTGVDFLYQFLIRNKSVGPYGTDQEEGLEVGDIAQLSFDGEKFTHSLLMVEVKKQEGLTDVLKLDTIYTATHTYDSYHRSIASYPYQKVRFIHIQGVRKW